MDLDQINENLRISFKAVKKDMQAMKESQNKLAERIKQAADEKHEDLEREFESKIHNLQIDAVKTEQFDILYKKVVELEKAMRNEEEVSQLKRDNEKLKQRLHSLEVKSKKKEENHNLTIKKYQSQLKNSLNVVNKEKDEIKRIRKQIDLHLVDYKDLQKEFMSKKEFSKKVSPVERKVKAVMDVKNDIGTKVNGLEQDIKNYAKKVEIEKNILDTKNDLNRLKKQITEIDQKSAKTTDVATLHKRISKVQKAKAKTPKKAKKTPFILNINNLIKPAKKESKKVVIEPLKTVNVKAELAAEKRIEKIHRQESQQKRKKLQKTANKASKIKVDAIKPIKTKNTKRKPAKTTAPKTVRPRIVKKTTVVEEIKPINVSQEKEARSFLDRVLRRKTTTQTVEEIPSPPKKKSRK